MKDQIIVHVHLQCYILTMMHSLFITIVTFCYRIFLGTIEPYCVKYWDEEAILSDFIKPQRKAYANVIQGKLFSKGRIDDLTIEGTVASVIDMVCVLNILGVICNDFSNHTTNSIIMPWWAEPRGIHTVVVLSVILLVCHNDFLSLAEN